MGCTRPMLTSQARMPVVCFLQDIVQCKHSFPLPLHHLRFGHGTLVISFHCRPCVSHGCRCALLWHLLSVSRVLKDCSCPAVISLDFTSRSNCSQQSVSQHTYGHWRDCS